MVFVIMVASLYMVFPAEIVKRIILVVLVFIIYPVTVLLIRKFWKYFFNRKKTEAESSIEVLKKEKAEILENVMEKEPYNKAKEILKKFAPQQLEHHTPAKASLIFKIQEAYKHHLEK